MECEEIHLSIEELESEDIEIVDEEDEDEDEEIEYIDVDINDEEVEEELEEMTSPRVSCWLGYADGKTHHGIMLVPIEDYDDSRNKSQSQFDDACAICFQPLSGHGKHQVCCLPCGHIYGLSCIKKWLLQTSSSGSGKCPQCNRLCTYKDVIRLYAGAHQKAASSTRYFPFTKQGFIDFKKHEWLRHAEAKKKLTIDSQLLVDILELMRAIAIRRPALLTQWKDLVEQLEDQTEEPADALQQQADALKRQADALGERYDVLGRRADVLEQRTDVLCRRYDAYWPSLKFFKEMYKEHLIQQKK